MMCSEACSLLQYEIVPLLKGKRGLEESLELLQADKPVFGKPLSLLLEELMKELAKMVEYVLLLCLI